jgi:hypothetical protein
MEKLEVGHFISFHIVVLALFKEPARHFDGLVRVAGAVPRAHGGQVIKRPSLVFQAFYLPGYLRLLLEHSGCFSISKKVHITHSELSHSVAGLLTDRRTLPLQEFDAFLAQDERFLK